MKHHKALALVITVLTCACIGHITSLRAEMPDGFEMGSVLPQRGEALVRLSVGELGRAILRAEESEQRTESLAKPETPDCKEPSAPDYVLDERKRLDPIMTKLSSLLAQRDGLIRKLEEYRQLRLDLQNLIAGQKATEARLRMAIAIALLLEGDPLFTKQGSQQEAALKQGADKSKKQMADVQLDQEKARERLVQAELAQKATETEINVLQEEIGKALAPRDDSYLTVFQRLLAYGQQAYADSFEAQALRPEQMALLGKFHFDFVKELERIPPQRLATLKSEVENMTSRGDFGRVQQLLAYGAGIYQPPGEYSTLALAQIFGQVNIARSLRANGATVTVPWDPFREEPSRHMASMLESQFARVQGFLSSVKMTKRGDDKEPEYYAELLRYWGCRLSGLTGGTYVPFRAPEPKRRTR